MSDTLIVAVSYLASFGLVAAYAIMLHLRWKKNRR